MLTLGGGFPNVQKRLAIEVLFSHTSIPHGVLAFASRTELHVHPVGHGADFNSLDGWLTLTKLPNYRAATLANHQQMLQVGRSTLLDYFVSSRSPPRMGKSFHRPRVFVAMIHQGVPRRPGHAQRSLRTIPLGGCDPTPFSSSVSWRICSCWHST